MLCSAQHLLRSSVYRHRDASAYRDGAAVGLRMKIICIRTGKVLADKLSATEIGPALERCIREACRGSHITSENTEKIVANYRAQGFHPFMFDVRP